MGLSRDVVVGGLALAIAAVYYLFSTDIQESLLADTVGARGVPTAYALALAVVAILLIVQALVRRGLPRLGLTRAVVADNARALGLVALGALYLMVIDWVGYVVAVFLLLLAVALYVGAPLRPRLVAMSAAGAVLLWVAFAKLFALSLPSGSLWRAFLG